MNLIKLNTPLAGIITSLILLGCGGGGSGGNPTTIVEKNIQEITTSTINELKLVVETKATVNTQNASTTIEWELNKKATGQVEYGVTTEYGEFSAKVDNFLYSKHTFVLDNLQEDTLYHYRIISEDENGTQITSENHTFKTPARTEPEEASEPIVEPTPEPAVEELPESISDPTPESIVVETPQSVIEEIPLPIIQPTPEPTVEEISKPVVESLPQPAAEPTPQPTVEEIPESISGPAHESIVKPTVEEAPEPIVEPTPEPTVSQTPTTQVPTSEAAKAIQQGKITDIETGTPLANVEVSIGDQSTTTDAQGYYQLTDIPVSDKTVVNFAHEDYYRHSKIIALKEYSDETTLSPNHLEVKLNKYDDQHSDDSANERLWSYFFGIKIPGGTYTLNKVTTYSGDTVAKVAYEDVSTEKGRDAFPGAYKGKNSNGIIVPFVAYGLMVVDVQDGNGISLSTSDEITLTFHTANGTTAESIPLWYYDYAQGLWIEEGEATRLPDGKYEGTVSRPGTWSLSQPIEDAPGIYTDRIIYPDGTPVQNLRVHAVGTNWIKTDLTTDENGVFEIEVIPGEEFSLKVYHFEDKFEATYNGTISAVNSGDIASNIQ